MTKESMNLQIRQIEKTAYDRKQAVSREYAMSNNPYSVGDIIEDHFHRIQIEKVMVTRASTYPECFYQGTQLKKDNTPFKNPQDTSMYQSNVQRKIQ